MSRWLFAAVLALGACSSSGDPGEAEPETTPPPIAPPPIEPENGEPSADALRSRQSLQAEPVEGEDCGTMAVDSGWPTTLAPLPDRADCLLTALGASRTATQTFTGRTGDGGALLTRYVVRIDGTTKVSTHVISAQGDVESEVVTCEVPPGPWMIGIDGRIAVDNELVC